MNLNKLIHLAGANIPDLESEDQQLAYSLIRNTTEPLIRGQLLPRVRAPYQLQSLEQSTFNPGQVSLSWADLAKTRVGVGQSFEVTVPKGANAPMKGTGIQLNFNDQLQERPELGQTTGLIRPPKAMEKWKSSPEQIRASYKTSAATPAAAKIQFGQGKIEEITENENGTYTLKVEVTERKTDKLNWHFQKNYASQMNTMSEMAPQICAALKEEATSFFLANKEILGNPKTLEEALETYAIAAFALPEKLMTNFGARQETVFLDNTEETLASVFREGINNFAKQFPDKKIGQQAYSMIHGVADTQEPNEMEVENAEKRIAGIEAYNALDTIVGPTGRKLCVAIFQNHREDDTLLTRSAKRAILMPTLGLPGDADDEQADREKTQDKIRTHQEEENRGEETEIDSNEEHIAELIATEKGRSRPVTIPQTARAVNALREYPGNEKNHKIRTVMRTVLSDAEKGAPMQPKDISRKLKELFRAGTPAEKLGELEQTCATLGKRLSANLYSGNPADILLRILAKSGVVAKDAEMIKRKGGHNVANAFLKFTSRQRPGQNPLHPASNRLVTYALFNMQPQGEIPREALADFAARLSHARMLEPIMFKPSELLLTNQASKTNDTLHMVFDQMERDSAKAPNTKAIEQVAELTLGIVSILGQPDRSKDLRIQEIGKRLGIPFQASFKARGEENMTSRTFLSQVAMESIEAQPHNISKASSRIDEAFKPFENIQMPQNKEVVVKITLDQLRDINSRIPGAEAFGGLSEFNAGEIRAVTTDAMLPAVWAVNNGIPWKAEIDQVNLETLTETEKTEVDSLLKKAFAATEKELASDNVRSKELRKELVVLDIGKALTEAKTILDAIEDVKAKPRLLIETLSTLRGNKDNIGFIPALEAAQKEDFSSEKADSEGEKLPGERILNAFNEFKTNLQNKIALEKADLQAKLPEITQAFEETRQIEAFLAGYKAPNKTGELKIEPDGSLSANQLWIRETLDSQKLEKKEFDTLLKELVTNPPATGDKLILKITEAVQNGMIVDAAISNNPKNCFPSGISFRTEEGVLDQSILNGVQKSQAHLAAVNNYATTSPDMGKANIRYDQSPKATPQTNSPGLI